MTARSDFTDEEWDVVLEAPITAGMMLITASGGGTFRETWALAHAYSDARGQHGASELLDEIVATKPKFDRHRYPSNEELHTKGLEAVGAAAALLKAKATPEEAAAYRDFVLAVAQKVAAAHKEDGQAVSPAEQSTIDEIRGRFDSGS